MKTQSLLPMVAEICLSSTDNLTIDWTKVMENRVVFTAEMRDEAYEERLRRLNKVKGLEAGEEKDETRARRVAFRGFVPRKGPLGNLKLGIPRYQKPGILYLYMCPQRAAQHTTHNNTTHGTNSMCVRWSRRSSYPPHHQTCALLGFMLGNDKACC